MCKEISRQFDVSNPKLIYDEAEAFLISADAILSGTNAMRLKRENFNLALLIQNASNVNHVLAFELYLKCLIAIETKKSWRGHPLDELFEKLSVDSQNKIIAYHDNYTYYNTTILNIANPNKKYDFISLLTAHSKAFLDLRYLYERQKDTTYELDFPIKAVKRLILELRPDFKS